MARFLITGPSGQTQIFEISGSTVNIGRADSNDLVLNHPSVSRHHVRLTVLPGDTTLLNDLGSLNGTLVNSQQIHEHPLADQDRVNIGMYELKYDLAKAEPIHVEAGARPAADLTGLVSPEALSTSLRVPIAPGVPPAQAIQERLRDLEKENRLLKLLLGVGKTLSSVLTAPKRGACLGTELHVLDVSGLQPHGKVHRGRRVVFRWDSSADVVVSVGQFSEAVSLGVSVSLVLFRDAARRLGHAHLASCEWRLLIFLAGVAVLIDIEQHADLSGTEHRRGGSGKWSRRWERTRWDRRLGRASHTKYELHPHGQVVVHLHSVQSRQFLGLHAGDGSDPPQGVAFLDNVDDRPIRPWRGRRKGRGLSQRRSLVSDSTGGREGAPHSPQGQESHNEHNDDDSPHEHAPCHAAL